jgi:hypothetical protein
MPNDLSRGTETLGADFDHNLDADIAVKHCIPISYTRLALVTELGVLS